MAAGQSEDGMIETFIDTGHRMTAYLEERTPVQFSPWSMPDYHMEFDGAKAGGRSIETLPFTQQDLGEWSDRLKTPPNPLPLSLQERIFQYQTHVRPQNAPDELVSERSAAGLIAGGSALIGRLLKSCLDRGIAIMLDTRAIDLVREDRNVTGLRARRNGEDVVLQANGGVVLASGGFEWNDQLKKRFLSGPLTHPNSPPSNEGDGLIMAMEAGAALGTMTEVWGSPAATIPGEKYDGRPLNRLVVPERLCPHSIMVNRTGNRFVNEGTSYDELGKVFNEFDPTGYRPRNVPAWAIVDRQYRERYPVLTLLPDTPDPDWLPRNETLEGLANQVGIDSDGLTTTVASWNEAVGRGTDAEFGRHRSPMDLEAPHPSMGSIERPPFYALPVHPGTLGTKGGPVTNPSGQVLDVRGDAIAGLYAAGNVMAGISGPGYFGGGATIGLAMTWGYICGISAAESLKS
jgi:succinate dehydrogenase/fumarate reductase flavoprotein subunit